MSTPTDTELLLGAALKLLELRSTAELEHVITCATCYVFDSYDGGPHWCGEFGRQFRPAPSAGVSGGTA